MEVTKLQVGIGIAAYQNVAGLRPDFYLGWILCKMGYTTPVPEPDFKSFGDWQWILRFKSRKDALRAKAFIHSELGKLYPDSIRYGEVSLNSKCLGA